MLSSGQPCVDSDYTEAPLMVFISQQKNICYIYIYIFIYERGCSQFCVCGRSFCQFEISVMAFAHEC